MPEILPSNNAESTLSSGVDSATTTIPVANGALFPSTGNFRIVIDSEKMLCTARSGNNLTVTRAQESSSAASHSANAVVSGVLTNSGLDTYFQETITSTTYANRSSASRAGRIWKQTDGPFWAIDNGSTWDEFVGGQKVTPPTVGDFSWDNQGSATAVGTYGGIYVQDPAGSAGEYRILYKTAPSIPYTITMAMLFYGHAEEFHAGGLVFRQSSDGKIHSFNYEGSVSQYRSQKLTDSSTFSANYSITNLTVNFPSNLIWIRIADNNTNRVCSVSLDGQLWIEIHSVSRTDFLTGDQVGFRFSADDATWPMSAHFVHWEES